jgi:integrase
VARDVWRLDVSVEAAKTSRSALSKIGLIGKSEQRERRVSDDEIKKLAAHFKKRASDVPMADIVEFSVASAMRISEVCRLQWSDINKKDAEVIIRDRKHPTEKAGNDQVVPLLKASGFDAMAIVERQPRVGPRIFPYNPRTVSKYFADAVTALKIEDLRLHDLRHEAISRLFEAGYHIEEVALVSGHRDWAMLKRYTHLKAKDLHRRKRA